LFYSLFIDSIRENLGQMFEKLVVLVLLGSTQKFFFGKPTQNIFGFTIIVLSPFENSSSTMWVFWIISGKWQMAI